MQKPKEKNSTEPTSNHEHGRGDVNHDALAALVTSKTFRSRVEKPKKGKGSYKREKIVKEDY